MESTHTNKELLQMVLHQTKENAKNQLTFAGKVSTFMNEQNLFNSEIKSMLESNDKTKQKGIIEQQSINTKDINTIKNQTKIAVGVSVVLGFISGLFSNLFK